MGVLLAVYLYKYSDFCIQTLDVLTVGKHPEVREFKRVLFLCYGAIIFKK